MDSKNTKRTQNVNDPEPAAKMQEETPNSNTANNHPGFDLGGLFWGLGFILIGSLFLLHNLGFVSVDLSNLWRLWPLILVAIGLSIISLKGLVPKVVAAVLLIAILAVSGLVLTGYIQPNRDEVRVESQEVVIEQEGKASQPTKVSIDTGAGKLTIDSGDIEGVASARLESSFATLRQSSTVRDGAQEVTISSEGSVSWPGNDIINNLNVTLSRSQALELDLDFGAAKAKLDLADVLLQKLAMDIGASKADVTLGDRPDTLQVDIDAGMSNITLRIPENSGVRVEVEAGMSSRDLEGLDEVSEGVHQSKGYDNAAKKVVITGDIGMAKLEIDRY